MSNWIAEAAAMNQDVVDAFGIPCQFVPQASPSTPVNFQGVFYAPGINQQVTLSPMRALAISGLKPTVWARLADVPTSDQGDTIIIDPAALFLPGAPIQYKIYDSKPDGLGGITFILQD